MRLMHDQARGRLRLKGEGARVFFTIIKTITKQHKQTFYKVNIMLD